MIRLSHTFLPMALACFCPWSGAQSIAQAPMTDSDSADLSLVVGIESQSYCHSDDESFVVRLKIRLKFVNQSGHRIILARHVEGPQIIRVAKTVDDGTKGDFEYNPNFDYFVSDLPNAPAFGAKPGANIFVTLRSHESYEVTVETNVFGASDFAIAKKGLGLLPRGTHVLQLGVGTWPYHWPYFSSKAVPEKLAKEWQSFGQLVYGTAYSQFVPLNIPDKMANPVCKSARD